MDTSAERYFDRMVEILDKKRQLLEDMLALTQAQTQVITAETLDKLKELIDEKQEKIEAIDMLDEEFSVYFERLKTTANVKKLGDIDAKLFPGAKRLKERTGEILKLVDSISEIEKSNNHKSKKLHEELGSEIKKINQGKRINNAYNPSPSNPTAYFLDKKK
ncbi:MAG: flagellar protein FlgN [Clostridiaceae bacterium]|nr:flagellar protein FlgN [Clostridiaceae bacterium]